MTDSQVSQRQLEILKRLAAREAARRQQLGEKSQSSSPQPGGRISETREDTSSVQRSPQSSAKDVSIIDSDRLEELLQQEKAKNDFTWAKVRERTHRLTEQQNQENRDSDDVQESRVQQSEGKEERMRKKRIELEYLDFEIEQAQKDLTILEPAHNDAILALLTRATLASAAEQYQHSIASLERELDEEKKRRKEDEDMLHDIGEVRIGLEKRKAVLTERLNSVDFASMEGKLMERVDGIENELSHFLRSLIDICSKIFIDEDGVQQAQLRLLIDNLINKAWDTPVDPYVDISEGYLPAISAFLLRANIAIEHPRDSSRIRLIDFQRSAVG